MKKICKVCGIEKNFEDFNHNRGYCKECQRVLNADYFQKSKASDTGYTYAIVNTRTHRAYIGSTTNMPCRRWSKHVNNLRKGTHTNRELQADWNSGAESDFEFVIMGTYPNDKNYLRKAEQMLIDLFSNKYNQINAI